MERVIAYVDGLNRYFGMKESRWQRFYWLDIQALVRNLLKSHQELKAVNYFTARVSGGPSDPAKPRRQNTCLEALLAHTQINIHYGHYLEREQKCFRCGNTWDCHEEKGTDVNIATRMLLDAFHDQFDAALLLSADSDLAGPVQVITQEFSPKRVVMAFPPNRHSAMLKKIATASFTINRAKLSRSQLPQEVRNSDGVTLRRPPSWT